MRDYADLIKTLRRYGAWEQHSKDAADAIEELLAKNNELWIQLHVDGCSLISEPPKEVQ